jgi:hypothetical protein
MQQAGNRPAADQGRIAVVIPQETMQWRVQQAVVDQVSNTGQVTVQGVREVCPRSDQRDVALAITYLIRDGVVAAPPGCAQNATAYPALLGQMRLRVIGEAHLADHA